MRAKNAGTRRSVTKTIAAKKEMPRGRPFQRKPSEYENQPERFPGLHVAIAPTEAPRDIDAPTVGRLCADGYHVIDAPKDFPIADGHQLIGIDAAIFGKRMEAAIAESNALLNPDGQPQSEEEMKDIINRKMTPGQFGSAGRADRIRTLRPVSLSQAEGELRAQQRDMPDGSPIETGYFNDTE